MKALAIILAILAGTIPAGAAHFPDRADAPPTEVCEHMWTPEQQLNKCPGVRVWCSQVTQADEAFEYELTGINPKTPGWTCA